MFSLTYYIMFSWAMVVASLSSESTIRHSLWQSGLDSGAQARPLVTVVCAGNGGQNFFQKHTGGNLQRLKILECTMVWKYLYGCTFKYFYLLWISEISQISFQRDLVTDNAVKRMLCVPLFLLILFPRISMDSDTEFPRFIGVAMRCLVIISIHIMSSVAGVLPKAALISQLPIKFYRIEVYIIVVRLAVAFVHEKADREQNP